MTGEVDVLCDEGDRDRLLAMASPLSHQELGVRCIRGCDTWVIRTVHVPTAEVNAHVLPRRPDQPLVIPAQAGNHFDLLPVVQSEDQNGSQLALG